MWLVYGCGLRIGEALAVSLRCRINRGETLRVKEQVNPVAQLRPLKFGQEGEFRDGLTGQQGGCAYSVSLRWTIASYSCS